MPVWALAGKCVVNRAGVASFFLAGKRSNGDESMSNQRGKPARRRVMSPTPSAQYLTYEECARRLQCGVSTIRQWVRSGAIHPIVRLSRRAVRVPEQSLSQFVASRTV